MNVSTKVIFFLAIIFIFFSSYSLSQQGWFQQSIGTNFSFNSCHFIDENNGWIVGGDYSQPTTKAVILKTEDGGWNWASQFSNVLDYALNSVYFINSSKGWAVGTDAIMTTTNGGTDWLTQSFGYGWPFYSVFFIDENIGWIGAIFGRVLLTTDGGASWTIITGLTNNALRSIYFLDVDNGWAVGDNGTILESTDGGQSWETQTSGTNSDLHSVYFTNQNIGWIVGEQATILKTTDAGISWQFQSSGTTEHFREILFTQDNTGWIVGSNGTILKRTDGGTSWILQTSGTDNSLNSVHFTDNNIGWVVGQSGTILKTTTGGATFIENENDGKPNDYGLTQNYPNPFNPITTIKYQIPEISFITLKVYDVLGNEVTTLVNEEKSAGSYEIDFDGNGLSSGIYFYQMKSSNFVQTKKMILMK